MAATTPRREGASGEARSSRLRGAGIDTPAAGTAVAPGGRQSERIHLIIVLVSSGLAFISG